MAAKIKMLKLLQETPGFAEVTNRRPKPQSAAQVMTQMRPTVIQAVLPRRKLSVASDNDDLSELPRPVKINHVSQDAEPAAVLPPSRVARSRVSGSN